MAPKARKPSRTGPCRDTGILPTYVSPSSRRIRRDSANTSPSDVAALEPAGGGGFGYLLKISQTTTAHPTTRPHVSSTNSRCPSNKSRSISFPPTDATAPTSNRPTEARLGCRIDHGLPIGIGEDGAAENVHGMQRRRRRETYLHRSRACAARRRLSAFIATLSDHGAAGRRIGSPPEGNPMFLNHTNARAAITNGPTPGPASSMTTGRIADCGTSPRPKARMSRGTRTTIRSDANAPAPLH